MAKVWFVGAGPGDPELITLKAQKLIQQADAILVASSLLSSTATQWAKPSCDIADSNEMSLGQITAWLLEKAHGEATVICLQSGDPGLYGALIEMLQPLDAAGIEVGVVPGVTFAMAAAAAACESLTLAEVTQTVIFTRVADGTATLEGESLLELAQHHCTLCLYSSVTLLAEIQEALLNAGWDDDAAVLVVYKASCAGEEKIIRGTLTDIREKCSAEEIPRQAMIIISPTLGAREWPEMYDAEFSHRYRKTKKTDN